MSVYTLIDPKFVNMIDIDFETRSKANIKNVGAWAYAKHPSTEILLLRYSIEDGKIHGWRIGDPPPARLLRAVARGMQIRAHSWLFEFCIWNFVCVKKLGWPELDYTRFECTAALANRFGFPASLENAGETIGLPVVKDKKGKQLIQKFSTPSKRKAHEWNEPEEFPEAFDEFDDYCRIDVVVQIGIVKFCPHLLEKNEMKLFRLTQLINIRGIPIDKDLCLAAEKLRIKAIKHANIETLKITKGKIKNIRSRDILLEYISDNGLNMIDMRADTIEKTLKHNKELKPVVRRLLELRKSASKNSTAKFKKAIDTIDNDDGRFHGGLVYYKAAKTGRWAGALLQPHNFAKPNKYIDSFADYEILASMIKDGRYRDIEHLYGDVMEALSSSLRSMIYAPEGMLLKVADYSQIEARFVFWFAGEESALKAFRNGEDIYKNTAVDIFSMPLKMIGGFERFVGKQAVLGLGFQMGDIRFRNQCIEFADIDIGKELAKKVVKYYRGKYKGVAQLWNESNKAAMNAIENCGEKFYCAKNRIYYVMYDDNFLICVLPSGRKLYYPFARIKMKDYYGKPRPAIVYKSWEQAAGGWVTTDTYGGKLVENYVQATARDFMGGGMLKADSAGYEMILSVHDEPISLVNKNFGSIKELEAILCECPKWAKGFPSETEGWEGTRYKKA